MRTTHLVHHADARTLSPLDTNSVDLVVTSPPYPMIEMWNELFTRLNPAIGDALEDGNGTQAFDLMHDELSTVWTEIERVLTPGGIAAINIGDATRTIGGHFDVYPNNSQIYQEFTDRDFHRLPMIIWHKPTNSAAKFMGSGMIPPNAYPTQEHEFILLFRNGTRRTNFEKDNVRYESAYFWEERNTWFSDIWTDIPGRGQALEGLPSRDRSAAFPLDIPSRIIQMYSVYGDTVLDPFWGTGTTTLAASLTGRNSIGVEIEEDLVNKFARNRSVDFPVLSTEYLENRLQNHAQFIDATDKTLQYTINGTSIPVMTQQEQDLSFYNVTEVTPAPSSGYQLSYDNYSPEQLETLFQDLE